MVGVVLVGHGMLAPAVLTSIESVLGHPVPGMVAVGADPEDSLPVLRQHIAAAVASVDQGDGVIILTDMYGDSATNVSVALARDARVQVLSGCNLPILVKVISARNEVPFDDLPAFLIEYGREHILRAGAGGDDRAPRSLRRRG